MVCHTFTEKQSETGCVCAELLLTPTAKWITAEVLASYSLEPFKGHPSKIASLFFKSKIKSNQI